LEARPDGLLADPERVVHLLYYRRSVVDGGVLAGVTGEARRLAARRDL
jgi:hypothetical protein